MIYYSVHKIPPLVPNISRMNPIQTLYPIFKIHFNISSHLRLGLKSSPFPLGYPTTVGTHIFRSKQQVYKAIRLVSFAVRTPFHPSSIK